MPCKHHNEFHSNFVRECSIEITGDMECNLSKQLKELKMKPDFCLAFTTNSLLEEFEQFFPSFKYPSSSQRRVGTPKRLKEDVIRKKAYIKAGN